MLCNKIKGGDNYILLNRTTHILREIHMKSEKRVVVRYSVYKMI